jgi:hypothetical protein
MPRLGPAAVGGFAEVGFGHVESQFELGGHYTAYPTGGTDISDLYGIRSRMMA